MNLPTPQPLDLIINHSSKPCYIHQSCLVTLASNICYVICIMSSTRILVLGSGMVAPPCVEYLLRNEKNTITVGK